ncbi:transcriptional repressor [Kocuria soli]|uniref:Transcriptional repressor n=1 Tax=Kocuria soli TaxID=2485125 RepID=A0A3N3ZX04_9MICC|nr:transcriptional repressor [Kocuria soli]ROZ63050.1 transcriptional repressor [Kocuria soli]
MSSADSAPPPTGQAEPTTGQARNTKQRRAVRAALNSRTDFISTQELHSRLRDRGERVSLATTYRVLQSLAEAGEVDVLRNDDGEAIYRRCEAKHHHHHLVCRACGATVELEAPAVEAWAERTASAHGYTDLDHTIEIVGLCRQCRADTGRTANSDDRG